MTTTGMELIERQKAGAVLAFWFNELRPEQWFKREAAVDQVIVDRFGGLYAETQRAAQRGAVPGDGAQALAAVIVLDQFPRNMFRGSARAFESDGLALALAAYAIEQGFDQAPDFPFGAQGCKFLYMPYQHSEDKSVQARSVMLFATLGEPDTLDFAERHKAVIDRFGRFPHRNATLGRTSTGEELAFLAGPNSSF